MVNQILILTIQKETPISFLKFASQKEFFIVPKTYFTLEKIYFGIPNRPLCFQQFFYASKID